MTPLEFISQEKFQGFKPGFDRVRVLLEKLGHPERKMKFVHVAGTNGKGSTCACISSILTKAGYKTGLYISPYVVCWNERVQIGGEYISDGEFARAVSVIGPVAEAMEDPPSQFELETALALWYFADQGCEFAVMEVGMGGEWDATNVIPAPEAAVLCAIALDHTAVLGSTVAEIASVKAGIIKPGCDVVSYGNEPEAEKVIEEVCMSRGCRRFRPDFDRIFVHEQTLTGVTFDYGAFHGLTLPLAGTYQPRNAATVLTAAEILCKEGLAVSEDAIRRGLSGVEWHARFELLRRNDPIILYDGGHNPQGVRAAAGSIRAYFPDRKVNILSGVMADKDYDAMIATLSPVTARAFTVTPQNPRSLPAEDYAAHFAAHRVDARAFGNVPEALAAAIADSRANGRPLVCLGSLYLYAELLSALEAER